MAATRPMLATLATPPLTGSSLVYEPKYDGIRALVALTPGPGGPAVHIHSRLGNDKTAQFPAIARALRARGRKLKAPLLLDGEIVALDADGTPSGFQRLQGRIHVTEARAVEGLEKTQPTALIVFDLLRDGDEDVRGLPLRERRARLEKRWAPFVSDTLRLSEQVAGDGRAMHERAERDGWEGLIVKDANSPYQSGRRSPAWRKLKVVRQQEFVVGGWTEPRQTRQYFGALLLGVHDAFAGGGQGDGRRKAARPNARRHDGRGKLTYVGHTGTGFSGKELARVWKLLKAREVTESPFTESFKSNEPAHFVRPELVAQVRFTEWTDDNRLRHPVYLGLREDKRAADVVREEAVPERAALTAQYAEVVAQLRALEDARRDGTIALPDGSRLAVTNLAKVFWPDGQRTKGDLLRYYATVAPLLLPAVADRPLVMKRFPNGIDGMAFYQQRSRLEKPPAGVRIEQLPPEFEPITEPGARRFIGGSLITLLYMAQIAAISQDPWFSRVQSPLDADYVALDLDPGDDTPFARVLDVARWVRDELASLKVAGVPKTSGSSGLHVYVPLPPGTSYESGMLFCQIVATVIASRHPRVATVERTVRARPRGTVYVDYLQNIHGKTLATAYSARASRFAGVSTPLTWEELDGPLDPRDYTIETAPARFAEVGDVWARLRTSKPARLEAVFQKYARPDSPR
jgi:bifunctional non-homologous end joining protein LigD